MPLPNIHTPSPTHTHTPRALRPSDMTVTQYARQDRRTRPKSNTHPARHTTTQSASREGTGGPVPHRRRRCLPRGSCTSPSVPSASASFVLGSSSAQQCRQPRPVWPLSGEYEAAPQSGSRGAASAVGSSLASRRMAASTRRALPVHDAGGFRAGSQAQAPVVEATDRRKHPKSDAQARSRLQRLVMCILNMRNTESGWLSSWR
jgi:hypothetical protein